MRTQAAKTKAAHAVGPAEVEAVVDPAGLGGGLTGLGERVEQASAQAGGESNARVAKGQGELGLGLGLEEGGVASEGGEAGELGDGLEQVAALGEEGVVALVVCPGVGEAALERVTSVGADGGRGAVGEGSDLAPDARVAKRVLVSRGRAPEQLGGGALLQLLVAGPALEDGAREAIDLPLQVRVAQDGRVEGERVGRAGAGAQRAMGVERLGAAKEVAQLGIDVGVGLGGARFSARLDGVVAALVGGDVDVDIGGAGGSVGWVGAVEEDRDGGLEDAEAVQLVGGGANFCEDVGEGVVGSVRAAVGAEDWGDDLLEKGASCAVGVEDADRVDGDGEGSVVGDL